ncbi:condensin complex subunit 2 [Anthonomus grandis grandis]|uniref:condensin complex subunit 2 n=1 Tax=Anthonomus grandis grandis TaxID=2921223 RepID=UPI002166B785|nr:condensin complex subunit 2 [Anthonomus grandis grandis]XP_050295197.1 condensin complex subunit 2 [Anthonomus grandis grandis]
MTVEGLITSTPGTNKRLSFIRRGWAAGNIPDHVLNESNDEAERTERRRSVLNRSLGGNVTPVINNSSNALSQEEIKSQLKTFYQLYQDNKINAANVWNLKVFDCLKQLVKSGSNDVLNIAGSSLEVAGKVYGIKVDNLHSDALKLASHWARVFASKQTDDDNIEENTEQGPDETVRPKKKRQPKKGYKLCSNKEHVLFPEDSLPVVPGKRIPKIDLEEFSIRPDAKLSSVQNLLTYKHLMNNVGLCGSPMGTEHIWYGHGSDVTVEKEDVIFPINLMSVDDPICYEMNFRLDEWFPDETTEVRQNLVNTFDPLVVNDSGIPIAELDESIHDALNDIGGSDAEDLVEENAVEQAPLFRTDLPFVVNFVPSDSSLSLTNVTNNSALWRQSNLLPGPTHQWAGPEHWKHKGLKNNPLIYTGKDNQKVKQQSHTKRTAMKREFEPLDLNNLKPPVDFSNMPPPKKSKTCINIDPAKIRLPLCLPDLSFRELMEDLNALSNIPSIHVRPFTDNLNGGSNIMSVDNTHDHPNATVPENDEGNLDDNDLADDLFDNVEPLEDVGEEDRPDAQQNAVSEIMADDFIDAPELAEQIDLKYATKAKKTNMKKLKADVWCVLTQQEEYDEEAEVVETLFWDMAKQVELCHGTEDSSIPLIFVSLLHITNEQNLVLEQIPNSNDFKISGPKKSLRG